MKNKQKPSYGTFIWFKIFILFLTTGGILTIALSSNYEINGAKAENTIEDINFDAPFNNSFFLDSPFLVDYSTTTGLKPIGIRTTDIATEDFEV
ncbi:MAG: hypothetical protein WA461_13000, partial [Nitrososphaeraceae archaeon]